MFALVLTVSLATVISALCSTAEAMLYSVSWTYIERQRAGGSRTGQLLYALRSNVDRPIMAVLTLNTVANTAGSAIAGAFAAQALGGENVPYFAIFFTFLILICGEIIPKTLGVAYAEPLSGIFVYPLRLLITIFSPFLWLGGFVTRLLVRDKGGAPEATEEDIKAMASLSRKSGSIKAYEEAVIGNILALDQKLVEEVMTPRTMVFSLSVDLTVDEAYHDPKFWNFSRVPVYDEDNEDVVGLVLRRQLALEMTRGQGGKTLGAIMQPIRFVLESQTLDKVLAEFLESRQHLFAVLDEYGGLAGVISLEDVLEEMLGREIVDESDVEPDLRAVARRQRQSAIEAMQKAGRMSAQSPEETKDA